MHTCITIYITNHSNVAHGPVLMAWLTACASTADPGQATVIITVARIAIIGAATALSFPDAVVCTSSRHGPKRKGAAPA